LKKIVLASSNAKKLEELRRLLSGSGIEIISQREAGITTEADETGETFEENAYIKATAAMKAAGLPAAADDSGLVVDALGGAPGVHSARYGGSHDQPDELRNALLLKNLAGAENRAARFVCCICCVFPDGGIIRSRGECEGRITLAPRGGGGFGYDPIFEVAGTGKTMAELSGADKDILSHRGAALRKFLEELRANYADI
jgi:XTP/dITP diphosphohydrolase